MGSVEDGLFPVEAFGIMAEGPRYPAEICEILQNYKEYHISSEPASKPAGGSIFLFNRKVQRNFRTDGHNWKKKKDGKTLSEANERLKVGSVHMLHCYYAHGEENQNFQRRSYSMLEQDLSHIVLVHYREVKGLKSSKGTLAYTDDACIEALLDERHRDIDIEALFDEDIFMPTATS